LVYHQQLAGFAVLRRANQPVLIAFKMPVNARSELLFHLVDSFLRQRIACGLPPLFVVYCCGHTVMQNICENIAQAVELFQSIAKTSVFAKQIF